MIRKSTLRRPAATHEMARIACPVCDARLTYDPTISAGRIQCPKCLNPMDLKVATEQVAAPSAETPAARARPVEAAPQGVPAATETPNVLPEVPPAVEMPREALDADATARALLAPLQAERDDLLRRLRNAETMLAEAGQALDRFRELERRVEAIGIAYLEALGRVRDLERTRASR